MIHFLLFYIFIFAHLNLIHCKKLLKFTTKRQHNKKQNKSKTKSTNIINTISTGPSPIVNTGNNAFNAFVTYHMYSPNTPVSSVACSDGANGLITKYGFYDLTSLYPYVGAASFATWNSPECGTCWQLTDLNTKKSIKITIVDECGSQTGYNSLFDISPDAFNELGGTQAVNNGHLIASYTQLSSSHC